MTKKSKRNKQIVKKNKGGSNSPFSNLGNSLTRKILNYTNTGNPSLFNHSHKINKYLNRNTILIKDRDDKDLPILIELRKFIFSLEHRLEFLDLLLENDPFNQLYTELSDDAKNRVYDYYNTRALIPIFTYYQYMEYTKQLFIEYNGIKHYLDIDIIANLEEKQSIDANDISPYELRYLSTIIIELNELAKLVNNLNIEINHYNSTGHLLMPNIQPIVYVLPMIKLENFPMLDKIYVDGWLENTQLTYFSWAMKDGDKRRRKKKNIYMHYDSILKYLKNWR